MVSEECMSKAKKDFHEYRELLLEEKQKILTNSSFTSRAELAISSDDLPDEVDLAAQVVDQEVSLNMKERELNKLRQIEGALHRIDSGSFGVCEDCGDPIGKVRLKKQPWATLCIEHAEEHERYTKVFHKIG